MKEERTVITTEIFEYQDKALSAIKARTGIPKAYQIRQALDEYLERTGEVVKRGGKDEN